MQNQFRPEENQPPPTASLAASQTPLATETEAKAQATRLVTERLNEITRRAHRARYLASMSRFGILGSLVLMVVIPFLFFGPNDSLSMVCFLLGGVGFVSAMVLCIRVMGRKPPVFYVNTMAQRSGVQAIVPLFATLKSTVSEPQKDAIRYTLTTLLPLMKASDAALITPIARQTIHQWLHITRDTSTLDQYPVSLRLAALKALEQVGNSRDLPVVERLTNLKPRTPGEENIKQAAIECLPMLRAHCGEVETARTLLRASHSEDARPDTLLRPASGAAQTNPAELLRGAEPPDARSGSGD